MRVLSDPTESWEVYIYPASSVPARCYVKWKGGTAMVVLGIWRVIGDQPPLGLVDFLRSKEYFLWESWWVLQPE